jgi:cytochrome c-type biogenesis protein CcmE
MGRIGEGYVFIASELLAKHDENYMPPEISLQPAKDVAVD